jgi:hypothetical protein
LVVESNKINQLSINDEFIINSTKTSTRYKILEVSTAETNPRLELKEKVENRTYTVGV